MNHLHKMALICVCLFGLTAFASPQLTSITANNGGLKISGTPIASGTLTITPVSVSGQAIPFAQAGGGLNSPNAFSCSITGGTITGSCQVPDACLTTPANILYSIEIDATNHHGFVLPTVANVCGSSWALDAYAPAAHTTSYQAIQTSYGTAAPPSTCNAPAFYTLNSSGAGTLYQCVAGQYVVVSGGSGSGGVGPAGPTGATGTPGAAGANGAAGTAATISVGTITPLASGATPTIVNAGSTSAAVLNFGIPAGAVGATGTQGTTGTAGAAATIAVGTVTTLAAGSNATFVNAGTSSAALFNIGIPQGVAGSGGSGTVPTGTGFYHITSGVADSAARALLAGDIPALSYDAAGAAATSTATAAQKANNLSDLASVSTARTNLGLGSAATTASTAYDAAGAASTVQGLSLQKANNLSDIASASIARTNLGLGTAAITAASAYDVSGAAASVLASSEQTSNKNATNGYAGLSAGLINVAQIPTLNQSTTGNAATATAFLTTPTLCGTGQAPTGIAANGNATGCASLGSGGSMVYPGAGIPVSTGTAWGTSLTAPASALVGLTDPQALTNKTINGVTPVTMAFLDATSSIQTQLGLKAPLVSPSFTTPVLGTATATSINKLTITAPASLATLTIANSGAFTTTGAFGITLNATASTNVTLPTSGTLAVLASPTFTGTPAAPTATAGTNTTQLATTAFVTTAVAAVPGSTPLTLQHGGVANGSQTLLNIAAGANTTVTDNGTGTLTIASTASGSGGPNFVIPRDKNAHYEVANPDSNGFSLIGAFNGNSLGTITWNSTLDAAGYESAQVTTGTTINTPVGQVLNGAILPLNNPSFQATFHPSSAANVNIWLGICSYCQTNLANTAADIGPGNVAFVGFRHSSSVDASNWTCYASDSVSGAAGTAMGTGVAVSTTQMQVFDVIYVAGAPQFYINGTRVCSSFSATHLPGATVALGATASWQNTTTTAIVGSIFNLYFGAN
jgi:hypothetical protein